MRQDGSPDATKEQLREESKNITNGTGDTKSVQAIRRSIELDKMKEDRAKRNVFQSRSLSTQKAKKKNG